MLNNLRLILEPYLIKLGAFFSKFGLSPNFWTFLGLIIAIFSAIVFSLGSSFNESLDSQNLYYPIIGGFLLLIAGFFDIVDGAVARYQHVSNNKGKFLDSTIDRVSEIIIFVGIFLGNYGNFDNICSCGTDQNIFNLLLILSLSFSFLVSYLSSIAKNMSINLTGIGLGERAERILILAILSILGFIEIAIIVILVMSILTFIHRFIYVFKKLS